MDLALTILGPLCRGALTALQVFAGAFVLALAGGLGLALACTFGRSRLLRALVALYVEWMRNVPALAHLFLLYFGLAAIGWRLTPIAAACLGLGAVGAAVLCDIFRAGLSALHVGQREAALAAGLRPGQVLRLVLLPQMLRVSLPAVGNYATQLFKDTSIASAIAVPEIMFYARNLVTATFQTGWIYLAALALYACIVLPMGWQFARLGRRLEQPR